MLDRNQTDANTLQSLKRELNSLGYVGDLLQDNYEFADVLSEDNAVNQIALAAFAQYPPSYRNAAFGVAIANGISGAELIQTHRALGAPQIFEINKDVVLWWKISSEGRPIYLDQASTEQLSQVFARHKDDWNPQRILRAKSNTSQDIQLDFFDLGLLHLLEREARTKLDRQLSGAVSLAIDTFNRTSKFTDDLYPPLFRLIFRLIAAKMLGDRRHPGNWNAADARSALEAVEGFYFEGGKAEPALEDATTQQRTWEWIQQTCRFQNLSVDSLAYVYENTLVTQDTREAYGTHSTPYGIAEYVVRNLPFELLEPDQRTVFEPFSGHASFLVAAMQRLRELLPPEMASKDRHKYFIKMLSGIENDEFALEVAKLSLMLADYPNPDGWKLHKSDVFNSPMFDEELLNANIVLCNPPFGRFSKNEKARYGDGLSTTKAREALRRVLATPPQQLGFVLPKVFLEGREYRELRSNLAEIYSSFELLALPDRVFANSDAETVVLLSSRDGSRQKSLAVGQVLYPDLQDFYASQRVSYQAKKSVERPAEEFARRMWVTQLEEVWETTSTLRTVEDLATLHRGIEYNQPLGRDGGRFVSDTSRTGFVAGLHRVNNNIEPFVVTRTDYLDVSEQFMRGNAYKYNWSAHKLIVNANPQSRGAWRITASIDRAGLVCYQNFHAIWPKAALPLEVLAAVLNGPVANAFISTRDPIRHVHVRTLRNIPVPEFSRDQEGTLKSLVHQYVDTRNKWRSRQLEEHEGESECRRLASVIDAVVLNAYDLPVDQERTLLDWFTGSPRLGPFEFKEYFPRSFKPLIPWHQYVNQGTPTRLGPEPQSGKTLLLNELQTDFVGTPVEAGMTHESERTLARALSNCQDEDVLGWIAEFCTDFGRPSVAASILRCLANLHNPGTTEWRIKLVRNALHTGHIEIKEAAVRAVEHWGGSDLLTVLSSHQEDVPWLREYIEGVIDDLWE